MTVVLDSCAVLRLLEGTEPAASRVQVELDGDASPGMSWINVGEVSTSSGVCTGTRRHGRSCVTCSRSWSWISRRGNACSEPRRSRRSTPWPTPTPSLLRPHSRAEPCCSQAIRSCSCPPHPGRSKTSAAADAPRSRRPKARRVWISSADHRPTRDTHCGALNFRSAPPSRLRSLDARRAAVKDGHGPAPARIACQHRSGRVGVCGRCPVVRQRADGRVVTALLDG